MILASIGRLARAWSRWARMGAAITARSPEGRRFAAFGDGSYIAFPQGVLDGTERIQIGTNCIVTEHTVLCAGLPGAGDRRGEPVIVVGDRCVLGRGTEIMGISSIALGDDVWTASRVTIVDHHHRHDEPGVPVATQWPLNARPVTIGAGTVISTGAVILAGVHIGENSIVASGAQVRAGTYPPRSVLAGVPAKVIRTHSS